MPHVTFIHGLSNKPQADALHRIWREALARGDDGLELGALGVTSAMLYWADVLYPAPDPNVAGYESLDPRSADAFDASGNAETPPGENDAERALLAALRKQMTDASDATIAAAKFYEQCAPDTIGAYSDRMPLPADLAAPQLERVPLPWFIKVKIMKAYLRDAYLYLFDKPFSPRPGTTYAVRSVIRERVIAQLSAPAISHPHVVVSHSMGTLIAYDCLKRLENCPAIDALVTLGSPLGVDEIQDKLQPGWSRADGFPDISTLRTEWVNLFDPLDVVCGADPRIANDFRRAGAPVITDIAVRNDGLWRHSVVKYLARQETRATISRLLGL